MSPSEGCRYHFRYRFAPVGQGLFSFGCFGKAGQHPPLFIWVYDCGTLSSQRLVDDAITDLKATTGARGKINLLTLSHFDHDHISGVCRLIERFKIGTLMLPYMPLAQRLVLAFEEGLNQHSPLTGFFVNPVAYLVGLGGPGIDRILFVLPSGNDGPPFPEGQPGNNPGGEDDDTDNVDVRFEPDKPDDAEEAGPLIQAAIDHGNQTEVMFLKKGSAITFRSFWEFVPYNDDPETELPVLFVLQVRGYREQLLKGKSRQRKPALSKLRKAYDSQFGHSSEQRNVISLFLYSGPIYPSWNSADLWWYDTSPRRLPLEPVESGVCSEIYTGDGYLDTAARLDQFVEFIGDQRIEHTAVFQVMHHGAETNWHKGVADAIRPIMSVFSSDPLLKKWAHPHAAVLRDFWPFGPIQVDKASGFETGGCLG